MLLSMSDSFCAKTCTSQAATVGAAGATYPGTVSMLRSLTLIGPTIYRGNTNSLLLDAWAYFFGLSLDSVSAVNSLDCLLVPVKLMCSLTLQSCTCKDTAENLTLLFLVL